MKLGVYQLVELKEVTLKDLFWDEKVQNWYVCNYEATYYVEDMRNWPDDLETFSLLLIDDQEDIDKGKAVLRAYKTTVEEK